MTDVVSRDIPYPGPGVEVQIARLEERVDGVEADIADVRGVGVRLEGKLDRLTLAVVGAALSFAVGSGAVVAALAHFNT